MESGAYVRVSQHSYRRLAPQAEAQLSTPRCQPHEHFQRSGRDAQDPVPNLTASSETKAHQLCTCPCQPHHAGGAEQGPTYPQRP